MNIRNIFKNITPSVAVMVVGLLGAYMVYDNYFSSKVETADIAGFEPAAGEEMPAATLEVTTEAATGDAAAAVEGAVEAITQEAPNCLMDEQGNPVMGEDGVTCVPGPVPEGDSLTNLPAVEGGVVDSAVEAVEGAAEAVEGAVDGAMPVEAPAVPAAH